jgi:hypothetical protein
VTCLGVMASVSFSDQTFGDGNKKAELVNDRCIGRKEDGGRMTR